MATDIPKFQSFYKEYTKGPLFEYMMFQGPRGAPESVWNFTREGIRTSFIASYVVSQLASFVSFYHLYHRSFYLISENSSSFGKNVFLSLATTPPQTKCSLCLLAISRPKILRTPGRRAALFRIMLPLFLTTLPLFLTTRITSTRPAVSHTTNLRP